jgi:hypothetical protein
MKNFIKENWFKICIIIIIVITVAGLFYWKEYRPSQIRSNCWKTGGDAGCLLKNGLDIYTIERN